MDRVINSNQAYNEIPWRKQIRLIFLFMAVLVIFGTIAAIFLSINSRAAIIGRQIQNMRIEMENIVDHIEDMESRLATITSSVQMEQRAIDLKFDFATSDEIHFLIIEGYGEPSHAIIAPETGNSMPSSNASLAPEYFQTIWDLVLDKASILADEDR